MSIKCGHCKGRHESIAELRVCSGVPVPTPSCSEYGACTVPPASPKQITLINTMREERGIDEPVSAMTGSEARREIDRLIAIPRPKKGPATHLSNPLRDRDAVHEGRYAVEMDGVLKFYKVDKPTEGRWAGYTFVKVQASDELWPVRGAGSTLVLAAIAKDPQTAMLRYGRELGHCGHCGRTLTNHLSRLIGIGPICRRKTECSWLDAELLDMESERLNAEWAENKNVAAREEAAQESAAYMAEMNRDWQNETGL